MKKGASTTLLIFFLITLILIALLGVGLYFTWTKL